MNDKELVEKIRELEDPNGGNIQHVLLMDENFLKIPAYTELALAYHESIYKKRNYKWHQLVRAVLEDPAEKRYMYEKLLVLLRKYRGNTDDYFEMETEDGNYALPSPLAELNRLESTYMEYFQIYSNITNRIHVDYPKKEYSGPAIRGKINWQKTLRNSIGGFPTTFFSSPHYRKYDTPENILLILCAEWLYRESSRILQLKFSEPLDDAQRRLLLHIARQTKNILLAFPFSTVLNSSKRFWKIDWNDKRILDLESRVRNRLHDGYINNMRYNDLLEWIPKFKELYLDRLDAGSPTRRPLESIIAQDYIYEAWIFHELADFINVKKGIRVWVQYVKPYYFEFEYNNVTIRVYYDREFSQRGDYAWAFTSRPDFTVMVYDKIIALFDAKNYHERSGSEQFHAAKEQVLGYMANLDCDYAGLVFANIPGGRDPITLTSEPPSRRFHKKMELSLMRMTPSGDKDGISSKEQTLQSMFDVIIQKIPVLAHVK